MPRSLVSAIQLLPPVSGDIELTASCGLNSPTAFALVFFSITVVLLPPELRCGGKIPGGATSPMTADKRLAAASSDDATLLNTLLTSAPCGRAAAPAGGG